jgi:hypothetical protein
VAAELRPGMFAKLFAEVAAEGQLRARHALTMAALAVERAAKEEVLKGGTHKYGTKTPATSGGPPALISGTLRRSITHTPLIPDGLGWTTKVGPAAGFYPPYGGKSRTSASKYGAILEKTGLRNGATYPWLMPAYRRVLPTIAGIHAQLFRGGWPHV